MIFFQKNNIAHKKTLQKKEADQSVVKKRSLKNMFVVRGDRAFTLVEMIVSMAVFSVVAVVAIGALTKIVSANRKAQSLQKSITNLNFALDAISRELRVTNFINCADSVYVSLSLTETQSCDYGADTDTHITFNSTEKYVDPDSGPCNLMYAYHFSNTSGVFDIKKAKQSSCGTLINSNTYTSILDQSLIVKGHYVKVSQPVLNGYPLATIRISGYAGVKEHEKSFFDVQTSVSLRSAK